ncbi:hypothetical protein AcV5_001458 [Taiwanofungus camphoratus]|nr:hypothetical protein AcV5_001458 [Antrodia cinnamomea]
MSSLFLICVSFYVFCAYVTLVASKRDSRSGRQQPTTSGRVRSAGERTQLGDVHARTTRWNDYVPPPTGLRDCPGERRVPSASIDRDRPAVPDSSCRVCPWSADVNILQRHGARYPTKSASKAIKKALKKLQGAKKFTDPQMYFLHNFTYSLGKDDLVPFGAAESYEAGEQAFWRYADLMSEDKLPFVRASSKQRVVDSATNWTAGRIRGGQPPAIRAGPVGHPVGKRRPTTPWTTRTARTPGQDAQDAAWQAVYVPNITAALNAYAPGADLDDDDTASLMSLCPFETVAKMGRSGFCGLFKQLGAFAGYEYAGDGGGGGVGC